ncbi:CBS domain-containing protein CBSX1, chloroplastic-like [Momordica charantia]|uniref:CBS domain-containing protein CBSX1, chloroplastic-like n=1 Tax=Momordica charantia TaxID=3673 RepID=A0A6J1D7I0_MOMCH|nr:CBS domain-containing protein CBSX1, chloroplastic-like [Momordica charantia]
MSSISLSNSHALAPAYHHPLPQSQRRQWHRRHLLSSNPLSRLHWLGISDRQYSARPPGPLVLASSGAGVLNSFPLRAGTYTVGDFMTRKEDLYVVKPTTTVDEALEALVEKRITGFPVVDEDWNLVGVVSDYDLLALDSISGGTQCDTNLFPDVDSSWKTFNEIQKLLSKTNGKVVGDLMTPAPLVVRETSNLEDAARLLLETKYRRLPVVDADSKLVGIITRGNVVRAALQIKRAAERST